MSDLNPAEIYNRYERGELDKATVIGYLKSFIENSKEEKMRVHAVEYLSRIDLLTGFDFKFLESLLISDTNRKIRLASFKKIFNNFIKEGKNTILYYLQHENSPENLKYLYEMLENISTDVSEEFLTHLISCHSNKYKNKFNIIEKESIILFLLELELGLDVEDNVYTFDEEHVSISAKNGHVTSLEIFNLYFPELKFVNEFHELEYLTVSGTDLEEITNLNTLKKLRFLDLTMNNIKEIKGLEELVNLETLYLAYNQITKIKGLNKLKNLESVDFEDCPIPEGDINEFYNNFIPHLLREAESYCLKWKYDEAISKCKKILELNSLEPKAYYFLGIANKGRKKVHTAIHYYKKALKLDKSLKEVWYKLGISYFNLNRNLLAKGAFLLSLGLNYGEMKDEYVWIFVASIYARRNFYNRALKSSLKAIESNPKYWNAYTYTGYYYFILGKYDKAINIFKKAVKINSNDLFSWNYMGLSYAKIGKFDVLRKISEKIIKQKPKDTTARLSMGLLCMRDNRPTEALRHFKRAANNKNLDSIDCYTLAVNFERLDKFDIAKNLINRGLNKNPRNEELRELKKKLKLY